ncbi:MAG: ORF6N domain-containing protein [Candidatus Woesearchaeota archaeon]
MELELIKKKIYTIRGMQVILDRDLAEIYEVETRKLNQAVKRNIDRFPERYMFQINKIEFKELRSNFINEWISQNVTSNKIKMGLRKLPYAFTEHGITMLSSVLKSKKAIMINILIIDAFIAMRKLLSTNNQFIQKFQQIDQKLIEYDNNFDKIFDLMQNNIPKQGIFFDGQIFDSYKFVCDLIKNAKKKIILIDNYIDEIVLDIFTKTNVNVKIYTANYLKLDVEKYLKQYNNLEIIKFSKSHDRFLIIDDEVYHIGASLKDLGKKWCSHSLCSFGTFFCNIKKRFAFSKLNKDGLKILEKI